MQEPDLPYMERSPNAPFIRSMQEWIWRRFPTRQLSATDIFYVMRWAESGIPVSLLLDGFEAFLKEKPGFLDESCRLSSMHFLAMQIIAKYRRTLSVIPQPVEPIVVDDPYETALQRVTMCGRRTENSILREMLRKLYRVLRQARDKARHDEPDWDQRMDAFYRMKAHAILDWEHEVTRLCEECFELLSDQEREQLISLTPAEKMHCLYLGDEAQEHYLTRLKHRKIAGYFDFPELIESL